MKTVREDVRLAHEAMVRDGNFTEEERKEIERWWNDGFELIGDEYVELPDDAYDEEDCPEEEEMYVRYDPYAAMHEVGMTLRDFL